MKEYTLEGRFIMSTVDYEIHKTYSRFMKPEYVTQEEYEYHIDFNLYGTNIPINLIVKFNEVIIWFWNNMKSNFHPYGSWELRGLSDQIARLLPWKEAMKSSLIRNGADEIKATRIVEYNSSRKRINKVVNKLSKRVLTVLLRNGVKMTPKYKKYRKYLRYYPIFRQLYINISITPDNYIDKLLESPIIRVKSNPYSDSTFFFDMILDMALNPSKFNNKIIRAIIKYKNSPSIVYMLLKLVLKNISIPSDIDINDRYQMYNYVLSIDNLNMSDIYRKKKNIREALRYVKRTEGYGKNTIIGAIRHIYSNILDSGMFHADIPEYNDILNNIKEEIKKTDSLLRAYRLSKKAHDVMYKYRMLSYRERLAILERTKAPDLPEKLKPLEGMRIKNLADMIRLGEEYNHCLGSHVDNALNGKGYYFHYKNCVAQVDADGNIIQCYDKHDRITSDSKCLESIIYNKINKEGK